MRVRVVALFAAVAVLVTACGTGSEEATGDGGIGSGIGVHGAWSIDVYDTDGTLVRSAEFHNDLIESGRRLLHDLLSRNATMGAWAIQLGDNQAAAAQPCDDGSGGDARCRIVEPGWFEDANGTSIFETLTITDGEAPDHALTFAGDATVANTVDIVNVLTLYEFCSPTDASTACGSDEATAAGGGLALTSAAVAPLDWDGDGSANDGPIPVTAGQTIHVTVEISFGTLP